jgi:hypothetical protein
MHPRTFAAIGDDLCLGFTQFYKPGPYRLAIALRKILRKPEVGRVMPGLTFKQLRIEN